MFITRPDTPNAFVEKSGNTIRLNAIDPQAAAQGLAPGLTLADARARCPDLAVFDHDPHADHDWLERLAKGCGRYTPSVAIDAPNGLILDIAGCVHIFGGEQALIDDIEARLARAGVVVDMACGDTPEAARAFARFKCAPAPDEHAALRRLPVSALGLDIEATTALGRAGLKTVGDVLSRPLAALAARFGAEAATAVRCLTGEVKSPLAPRQHIASISVDRRFAEPIGSVDYILKVLEELTQEAVSELEKRHEGGRRFETQLFRADGMVHHLRIETGQPTRNVASVMRLFRERIGGLADPLDPGFGYDLIRLDVALAEKLDAIQLKLEGGTAAGGQVDELIDRLGVRLGRGQICRFVKRDTHVPEQAELMLPAATVKATGEWSGLAVDEPPRRPIYLFDPPQPIDLIMFETPDGPPRRFRWRRAVHEIANAEGPERIAGEWWRRRGADIRVRDYYRVEDRRGRRYWIFRHGLYTDAKPPSWYIHGLFA